MRASLLRLSDALWHPQKPTRTVTVIQAGWNGLSITEYGHHIPTSGLERFKVPIYPGMELEGTWLEEVNGLAEYTLLALKTSGKPIIPTAFLDGAADGFVVVITREDWKALSPESKLRVSAKYNVVIPRSHGNSVWEDVKDWSSLEALEQYVPLHSQHCVHGELFSRLSRADRPPT